MYISVYTLMCLYIANIKTWAISQGQQWRPFVGRKMHVVFWTHFWPQEYLIFSKRNPIIWSWVLVSYPISDLSCFCFGSISEIVLGSFWGHLESFWCRSGVVLVSFSGPSKVVLGLFWDRLVLS